MTITQQNIQFNDIPYFNVVCIVCSFFWFYNINFIYVVITSKDNPFLHVFKIIKHSLIFMVLFSPILTRMNHYFALPLRDEKTRDIVLIIYMFIIAILIILIRTIYDKCFSNKLKKEY